MWVPIQRWNGDPSPAAMGLAHANAPPLFCPGLTGLPPTFERTNCFFLRFLDGLAHPRLSESLNIPVPVQTVLGVPGKTPCPAAAACRQP